MATRIVKYFKRISETAYEPHSESVADRKRVMDRNNEIGVEEVWCSNCKAVVEPEGALDARGFYLRCIWCGKIVRE